MEAVKGIPYGVARFEEVRNENFYYADKTMYLSLLEETGDYLSLNRPHGFGKSLFTSMMWAYYDMAQVDKFDRLFGGLWVHEYPTPLKNAFQVIYFDFSLIEGSDETSLAIHFNRYCGQVLDHFAVTYAEYYDKEFGPFEFKSDTAYIAIVTTKRKNPYLRIYFGEYNFAKTITLYLTPFIIIMVLSGMFLITSIVVSICLCRIKCHKTIPAAYSADSKLENVLNPNNDGVML